MLEGFSLIRVMLEGFSLIRVVCSSCLRDFGRTAGKKRWVLWMLFTASEISTIGGIAIASLLHSFILIYWLPFCIIADHKNGQSLYMLGNSFANVQCLCRVDNNSISCNEVELLNHFYHGEFRRTRGNISSMREHAELLMSVRNDISEYKVKREHAELLMSVRNDISEYKASGSLSPGPSLLRERGPIHGGIMQIEDAINEAQATKGALSAQRTAFLEVQSKLKQLGDRFPVICGLLGTIKKKRSKDTFILSAVIAGCIIFLLIYWAAK